MNRATAAEAVAQTAPFNLCSHPTAIRL